MTTKYCETCKVKIIPDKNWGVQGFSPEGVEYNYCCKCIDKLNRQARLKKLKAYFNKNDGLIVLIIGLIAVILLILLISKGAVNDNMIRAIEMSGS